MHTREPTAVRSGVRGGKGRARTGYRQSQTQAVESHVQPCVSGGGGGSQTGQSQTQLVRSQEQPTRGAGPGGSQTGQSHSQVFSSHEQPTRGAAPGGSHTIRSHDVGAIHNTLSGTQASLQVPRFSRTLQSRCPGLQMGWTAVDVPVARGAAEVCPSADDPLDGEGSPATPPQAARVAANTSTNVPTRVRFMSAPALSH